MYPIHWTTIAFLLDFLSIRVRPKVPRRTKSTKANSGFDMESSGLTSTYPNVISDVFCGVATMIASGCNIEVFSSCPLSQTRSLFLSGQWKIRERIGSRKFIMSSISPTWERRSWLGSFWIKLENISIITQSSSLAFAYNWSSWIFIVLLSIVSFKPRSSVASFRYILISTSISVFNASNLVFF